MIHVQVITRHNSQVENRRDTGFRAGFMGLPVGEVAQIANEQGEFVDVPARIIAQTGFTMEVEIKEDGSILRRTLEYPTQVRECPPRLQSAFRKEFGEAEPSPPAWQQARAARANTPLLRNGASSAEDPTARATFDSNSIVFIDRTQARVPISGYIFTGPSGMPRHPKDKGAILANDEKLKEAIAKATGWSVGAIYFNGDAVTDHQWYTTMKAAEDRIPIVVCAEGEVYDAAKWADVAHYRSRSSGTDTCCLVM